MKDMFCDDLDTLVTKCAENDIKVLFCGCIVEVGVEDQESSVLGKYGLHKESNCNALSLIG